MMCRVGWTQEKDGVERERGGQEDGKRRRGGV